MYLNSYSTLCNAFWNLQLKNHIDGSMLADPDLNDTDLEELGIRLRLHRRRILNLVRNAVHFGIEISWNKDQVVETRTEPDSCETSPSNKILIPSTLAPTPNNVKGQHLQRSSNEQVRGKGVYVVEHHQKDFASRRRGPTMQNHNRRTQGIGSKPPVVHKIGDSVGTERKKQNAPPGPFRAPAPPKPDWISTRTNGDMLTDTTVQQSTTGNGITIVESEDDSDDDEFPEDFEGEEDESVAQLK